MNKGETKHKTSLGSMFTLLLLPVTLTYGVMRFLVMLDYKQTNILITDHLYYWTQDHIISTSKHNFQVAFAFINY